MEAGRINHIVPDFFLEISCKHSCSLTFITVVKRHFLENSDDVNRTIIRFAKGVLDVLRQQDSLKDILDDPNEVCFIVGCPVGWKEEDRKRYRRLLKEAGMQNVRIAAESRAAFEFAKNSFTGINVRQLNDSALVIDIGSSTLDLA